MLINCTCTLQTVIFPSLIHNNFKQTAGQGYRWPHIAFGHLVLSRMYQKFKLRTTAILKAWILTPIWPQWPIHEDQTNSSSLFMKFGCGISTKIRFYKSSSVDHAYSISCWIQKRDLTRDQIWESTVGGGSLLFVSNRKIRETKVPIWN